MKIRDKVVGILCGKTSTGKTANGKVAFNFSVAVYDPFKRENKFWKCAAFGKVAEIIMDRYEDKATVILDAEVDVDEWTNREGNKVITPKLTVTAVDMIEWRIKKKLGGYADEPQARSADEAGPDDDDDLPF